MALKIRLRQQGRKNRLSYRLVVTDVTRPRDGKYIEALGWYDPHRNGDDAELKGERVDYWLGQGAILTQRAMHLISRTLPDVMKDFREKERVKREKMSAQRRKNKRKDTSSKVAAKKPVTKKTSTEKPAAKKAAAKTNAPKKEGKSTPAKKVVAPKGAKSKEAEKKPMDQTPSVEG